MSWVIEHKNGKTFSLPVKIIEPKKLKTAISPLAWRILQALQEKSSYPKELGKRFKVHEQKIYYHIRNLSKAGLIKVVKEDSIHGVVAKFYGLEEPAFAILLKETEPSQKLFSLSKKHEAFLSPFVDSGNLNALVVLGSPEPHGPAKARAEDGPYGINLGLFLGTFLNYVPPSCVKLDTEVRETDLKNNLILIGGPAVNKIVADVNEKLPIRFKQVEHHGNYFSSIYSTLTKKTYGEEEIGIVVKAKNPWDTSKSILVIAGRRANGTKAAILSFIHKFDKLCEGNSNKSDTYAKVVEGVDLDSDGIVDTVEIKE